MKKYEIAALSDDEMRERIKEYKAKIAEIKFNKAIDPPANPMILRNLRRDIARMKTFLRQRELAAEKQKQKSNSNT
ncbi:MAG: 50S ribosomal protein L29 [Candidatus Thermochlorobacter aerophilum]|jgi:large subunit ribosomal protein L29|uniref:Large ribosomal subunit protein uL29 n=1 Tax=Candidatus Thermochlorobacter aerophilus TaxID=1868324 RepID=A0A395LWC2_9BACT|nr:MAG: 50S ribosomal protein L29 [Candidatus Thermochlorobacter aerophilum]